MKIIKIQSQDILNMNGENIFKYDLSFFHGFGMENRIMPTVRAVVLMIKHVTLF